MAYSNIDSINLPLFAQEKINSFRNELNKTEDINAYFERVKSHLALLNKSLNRNHKEVILFQSMAATIIMLRSKEDLKIEKIMELGIVERSIECLRCIRKVEVYNVENPRVLAPTLLLEAVFRLPEQIQILNKLDAVPKLLKFVSKPACVIVKPGRVVEGIHNRNINAHNIVALLVLVLVSDGSLKIKLVRDAVRMFANKCCTILYKLRYVKLALPHLSVLLSKSDSNVLVSCCEAIKCLINRNIKAIKIAVDSGVVPKLVELLKTNDINVLNSALIIIKIIITHEPNQVDFIVTDDGLNCLANLLKHTDSKIVDIAAYITSKIMNGNINEIHQVINAEIFPRLMTVLKTRKPKTIENGVRDEMFPFNSPYNELPWYSICGKYANCMFHDVENCTGAWSEDLEKIEEEMLRNANTIITRFYSELSYNIFKSRNIGDLFSALQFDKSITLSAFVNTMPFFFNLIGSNTNAAHVRNIVSTFSNLCRDKNAHLTVSIVRSILPVLNNLSRNRDHGIQVNSCWAFAHITDNDEYIRIVVEFKMVPMLIRLLSRNEDDELLVPVLRSIKNIASKNNAQTKQIILSNGLNEFVRLLKLPHNSIVIKHVVQIIKEITNNEADYANKVIKAGLLPHLIKVLQKGDIKTQKRIILIIINLIDNGSPEKLEPLLQSNAISKFCNLLDSKDWYIVSIILDGLENIIQVAERTGKKATVVKTIIALSKFNSLQNHKQMRIRKNYNKIKKSLRLEKNDE